MANPNFDPQASSDTLWYGGEEDVCLTDVIDEAVADIADLKTSKAPNDHTHTGYASSDHTHTGYASDSHTHTPASIGAAAANHSHDYAASAHSHAQSEISGLISALQAKAESTHDHTLAQIVGLVAALAAKADLVDGKVPADQLPGFVDDVVEYAAVSNFPATGESGKIYVATGTNKSYRWSGTAYVEIAGGVALGETSATAYRGDRGKTAYDHSQNSTVHVTAAQKTAWDGKAAGDHTHTPAGIGAATANHGHSYNDLSDKPTIPSIPASLPANGGNADTVDGQHASAFAAANHTHSEYAASGHTHSGYAASSHNHNAAYIAKSLQFTNDEGTVKNSYTTAAGKNVLTEIAAYDIGVYTVYSQSGVTGNPKTTEAWRFMVHKTGTSVAWVLGFGSSGSVYSNYLDGNGWKGWKCIFDADPDPLWSGASYLSSNDGTPQTVTPSKKLSECRTGWLLVWSDYDPGSGSNDSDFCTTIIPKYTPAGGTWGGKAFYCDIPMYVGGTATDLSTETRCIKPVYVHDNRLEGSYQNTSGGRNDVVLRAIYEI